MNKNKYLEKIIFSTIFICLLSHSIILSTGSFIQNNKSYNDLKNNIENILGPDSNIVVYSAHQSSNSRIVLISFDNTVLNKYDYSNKKFLDLEVVDNELYALDTINPSVYRINVDNGDLELVINDPNLINPYSLVYAGNYFYIVGSNLNRYDMFGNFQGTANFNETVYGAAWDGVFYWVLTDNNQIKCYDLSNWPNIIEGPFPTITPPSQECRGLFFDGAYFWTAEYFSSSLGNIYQFDYNQNIVKQLTEPYVIGWSACTVAVPNIPPEKPDQPTGPERGSTGIIYRYSTSTIDPDEEGKLYYKWDWGDNTTSNWMGPYNSSEIVTADNAWSFNGIYDIRVKAKDIYNAESEWSDPLHINITIGNQTNFIMGKISNLYTGSEYITFNADLLIWIVIKEGSFELLRYRSGEQLSISNDYFGILKENFVLCLSV